MNIRPSASIRQNYNEIADLCRISVHPNLRNNPVYITDEMLDEMYHYLASQN